ncbi:stage III sporulation protein SpoIIIAB [Clostridium fungisolvens]|uniref:Stage III sporulation protein AB n=1 Tax=Clostridium fungisolvens TaxID=1604897 RepID=A0A6V8SHL6_9CLOT|nr:stage III sporulation protein SpoIIIAB [Clostridium fungisolvens]GFP76709.1 Stage III sporulation protein AB [Clostridium fungisolvens]
MLVKYLLLLIIMALSSATGYVYGEKFKKRVFCLHELINGYINLENEMTYTFTPLPEAFINTGKRLKDPIAQLFNSIGTKLKDNEADNVFLSTKDSLELYKDKINLNEVDIDIILDLAKSLGTTGIDGQRKIFSITIDRIKSNTEKAEKECDKYSKMYKSLGVCVGFMLIIFLI